MIFDAHFHLPVCLERNLPLYNDEEYAALSCAHSKEEWKLQDNFINHKNIGFAGNYYLSYGLHPQSSVNSTEESIKQTADFLERLLQENQLSAIGEAGFDYFTPEYKASAALQEKMWTLQLELAITYKKPLVVHCRKANHKLFEYSKELKKCPAVLFHSFMGPSREALSLCNHQINAFFSFGKQLMNNNKKVIDCVKNLPIKNLLLETDAPFQTLKGEVNTLPQEIFNVYKEAAKLREEKSFDAFCVTLEDNMRSLLCE